MKGKRRKESRIFVRLTAGEKDAVLRIAEAGGMTVSSYVRNALLQTAGIAHSDQRDRRGPKGYEGQGFDLGTHIEARLLSKVGSARSLVLMDLLSDACLKNDHIQVWACLYRSLPDEVRDIPDRSQVPFLKSFMKAFLSAKP